MAKVKCFPGLLLYTALRPRASDETGGHEEEAEAEEAEAEVWALGLAELDPELPTVLN